MKKKISILIILCMIFAMLTACNSSTTDEMKDKLKDKYETESAESESEKDATRSDTESEKESETETKKPTETTKPTENTKPTETTKPTENTKPTETTKPTESVKPSQPSTGGSQTPSKPAETQKPVHTHSYSGTVTSQPTCANAGVKTYTCSCGDSYTESIPATRNHSWADHTATRDKQVWHEGATHSGIACACGQVFNSQAEYETHTLDRALAGDNGNHSNCGPYTYKDEGYYSTETETYIDYQYCTVCGTHK
ncbi:hypothetical protein [Frisingicoccus sp.]|uniref:hypothetical protein n=1 Tax=Frisingicoccus sp. TaxID=1918627 RepID=UPI00399ABCE9